MLTWIFGGLFAVAALVCVLFARGAHSWAKLTEFWRNRSKELARERDGLQQRLFRSLIGHCRAIFYERQLCLRIEWRQDGETQHVVCEAAPWMKLGESWRLGVTSETKDGKEAVYVNVRACLGGKNEYVSLGPIPGDCWHVRAKALLGIACQIGNGPLTHPEALPVISGFLGPPGEQAMQSRIDFPFCNHPLPPPAPVYDDGMDDME